MLWCCLLNEILKCNLSLMKVSQHYFPMVLLVIMTYKVALSVKILSVTI